MLPLASTANLEEFARRIGSFRRALEQAHKRAAPEISSDVKELDQSFVTWRDPAYENWNARIFANAFTTGCKRLDLEFNGLTAF
jgi:hypothetical protein